MKLNRRTRMLKTVLCVLIAAAVPLTVFAVKTGILPLSQSGSFLRQTIDRIDFSVENTEFVLESPSPAGDYTVSFVFSAKKTQADFYAVIDSLRITGLSYDNMVFHPLNENCDGLTLSGCVLPVKDGEPAEAKWQADMTFTASSAKTLSPVIEITYTSGMSEAASDTHILEIPLKISFR